MTTVQTTKQTPRLTVNSRRPLKTTPLARWGATLAATFLLLLAPTDAVHAQGGQGGQSGPASPPAASGPIKRVADRDDPIAFLLDRKKLLILDRTVEDSLKDLRKEMRHMQDVVFKDLDKAATKKENGQPPSATVILSLSKDSEERVKDIQSAYRDRARTLLNPQQRAQVDSVEAVWKRPPTN